MGVIEVRSENFRELVLESYRPVDVDELPRLAQAYGVSSIPTLLLFEDAVVKARTLGAKSAAGLERELGLASLTEGAA